MLKQIQTAIKESSLPVEVKKYVLGLVFNDLANKELNGLIGDLEKPSEPVVGEGAE